ncbi:MAG: aminotransferase class V-fold PLP-dependent enzyme [Candidatus Syntrophonatronum acetioxidans]|uniref:cysteine desulfurase n=1 Tax=Candidatus Syntrophonatronum acetioxidans TaxID=1795816 RepID=A0A424YDI2_9FIRM|nr:MAG: aminotransferase class V-fold PLP-dependent enzyme [Candidatus Syntrophonatronum acetioxidans]
MVLYMDNAATSYPKPEEVIKSMEDFFYNIGGNPGRSGHRLSLASGMKVYDTRQSLADLFNIEDPLQIVFTLNATMALNLALWGLLKPGDHVVTSKMEHNSLARPLRFLEGKGVEITRVNCTPPEYQLDLEELEKSINERTKLIAIIHGSNVTGTIFPLHGIGKIAERYGVWLLVDAAQTAGAYPLNVEKDGVHLLVFTGHKGLFGPQGTGGVYVDPRLKLESYFRGGTGSRSEEDRQPDFMPDFLESGTPNALGLAGLGAGVKYILQEGIEKIRAKEKELTERLLKGLEDIPGAIIYGREKVENRMPIVSFRLNDISPSSVGEILDEKYNILTRVGLHCSPWAHDNIGTKPEGTVRVSLSYFNSEEEVEYFLKAINEINKGEVDL